MVVSEVFFSATENVKIGKQTSSYYYSRTLSTLTLLLYRKSFFLLDFLLRFTVGGEFSLLLTLLIFLLRFTVGGEVTLLLTLLHCLNCAVS